MATLPELVRAHTDLRFDELVHLQNLVVSWQMLADLGFSDLMLFAPVAGEEGHRFIVLAQVRPTTGQTLYPADMVGTVVDEVARPLVTRAWKQAEVVEGDTTVLGGRERVHIQCIPVGFRGKPIGMMVREVGASSPRRPGELERVYLEVFDRIGAMIAAGTFPFGRDEVVEPEDAPRVSDGVIVLDSAARIRFASPNAMSSLHRIGIHTSTSGLRLSEVGFEDDAVDVAMRLRSPVIEEIERGNASILVRVTPLFDGERTYGAVMLMRDISDIRRRDRLLMSKDATIREIHHRVKNNLQTIAALLRLQGRRLESHEARSAIQESERRIRSIAIVHETLARDAAAIVPFMEIIRPLVRIVEETVSTAEGRIHFEVTGDAGDLPGELATPLAVVLNELMQNAVDHAFPSANGAAANARVDLYLERRADSLHVEVRDNGVGLPDGFLLDRSKGLGLSIVQALVTGELEGMIDMHRSEQGTTVELDVPVAPPRVESELR